MKELEGQLEAAVTRQAELGEQVEAAKEAAGAGAAEGSGCVEELERELGEARDWLEAAEGEKAELLKKLEEEQAGREELAEAASRSYRP